MVENRTREDGPSIRDVLRALPVFTDELPAFDADAAPDEPVALFLDWLHRAVEAGVPQPHAMTLATADERGAPSARVLICKDVAPGGRWYFASSMLSRKGRELFVNPRAALAFSWPQQGRQILVRGEVRACSPERSASDFLARPEGSRAEALVGRQSNILADPAVLPHAVAMARARLAADPSLVAPDWTLYELTADEVEFWQAHPERQHVRLCYVHDAEAKVWARMRLWP